MKLIKIILIILLLIFILGCEKEQHPTEFETITITEPGFFEKEVCEERELDDKVIMIESKYCSHCKDTLPIFKEACKEKDIEPIILDLAEEEHRNKLESYGIEVHFTPTFIFGCEYHIGSKTKEEYINLCEKFLE